MSHAHHNGVWPGVASDCTICLRAVNVMLLEALEPWVTHVERWHSEGQAGEGRRCSDCIEHETQARDVIEEAKK